MNSLDLQLKTNIQCLCEWGHSIIVPWYATTINNQENQAIVKVICIEMVEAGKMKLKNHNDVKVLK